MFIFLFKNREKEKKRKNGTKKEESARQNEEESLHTMLKRPEIIKMSALKWTNYLTFQHTTLQIVSARTKAFIAQHTSTHTHGLTQIYSHDSQANRKFARNIRPTTITEKKKLLQQ